MNKNTKHSHAKLLDYWFPPEEASDPIGCLATAFTFDSSFFENECLARFIGMESDPDNDGPVYLIELEEKLAGLKCASVIVDQHHCDGKRSLRWDLIPFRNPKSILHAKISLLCWANYIRIIIASANLTNDGYRRNQEIFGVIDIYDGAAVPANVLPVILRFLNDLVRQTDPKNELPEVQRVHSFFDIVTVTANSWKYKEISSRRHKEIFVHPVFIHPGGTNLFNQLREMWGSYSGPPKKAEVISPFFDQEESKNIPVRSIWNVLSQRGQAQVTYGLTYEKNPGRENQILLHAPDSLQFVPANRQDVKADYKIIDEQIKDEKSKFEHRPLHQKSIWLENNDWAGYMIGSSNFTSAGCGLGKFQNYEANLVYTVSKKNNKAGYHLLRRRQLNTSSIQKDIEIQWLRKPNLDAIEDDLQTVLPTGFRTIHYNSINDKHYLILKFTSKNLPAKFQISDEKNEQIIYSDILWLKDKKPLEKQLQIDLAYLPSGVYVTWDEGEKAVWWPINVSDFSVLPPPAELKDLPLDILISIISSSRPLHQILRKWLHKKKHIIETGLKPELDPHKKVDVSGFLLQRTRKISYALNSLKVRLEKPVFTQETLDWRLYGPVGVTALTKAILNEARSEEEKAFLVAEIALELANINPIETNNSLKQRQVRQELKKVIKELYSDLKKESKVKHKVIKTYMKDTFKKALHEF